MRKKLTAIILFSLWIFQSAFTFVFFQFKMLHYHQQVNYQRYNPFKKQILQFLIEPGKIDWTAEKKEFEMDGRLYDVVLINKVDHKLEVNCVTDEKEDELAAISTSLEDEKAKQNAWKGIQKKLIELKFTCGSHSSTNLVASECNMRTASVNSVLNNIVLEIASPPPRFS